MLKRAVPVENKEPITLGSINKSFSGSDCQGFKNPFLKMPVKYRCRSVFHTGSS
jgi:hypothetical protein